MRFGVHAARRVLVLALMVSLLVGLVPASAGALTQTQIRNRIYEKINASRKNHDLRALRRNDTVQKWAQDHAGDMARKQAIYHDLSLQLEVNKLTRIVWEYGENVGYMSVRKGIASKMHRKFMDSPDHRANILKPAFTHMGLGVVKRDGYIWVVERFVDLKS